MSRPNAVTKKKPAAPRAKPAAKQKKRGAPPTEPAAPRPAGPKAGKALEADTIRARRIEIIDSKGRPVIEIGTYRGAGYISVNGPGGRRLVVIAPDIGEEGFRNKMTEAGGMVLITGQKQKCGVMLTGARQGGQVMVLDAEGKAQGRLAAFDMAAVGGAVLNLRGRDGNVEAENGNVHRLPHPAKDAPADRAKRAGQPGFGMRLESTIW